MKKKLSLVMVVCLLLSLVLSLASCGTAGTPGADGKDGINGVNGIDGRNGADGLSFLTGEGAPAAETGKDGDTYLDLALYTLYTKADGAWTEKGVLKGADGKDGKYGTIVTVNAEGYWCLNGCSTGIYAGSDEVRTVTFDFGTGKTETVTVSYGGTVNYFVPETPYAAFRNWYTDENCTKYYNFNDKVTENLTLYAGWDVDMAGIYELVYGVSSYGNANCFGTDRCFGSSWARYLENDKNYYQGARGIANYLKGVFTYDEATGAVSVNEACVLFRISYGYGLTLINFASAYSSYAEAILRKGETIPEEIATQIDYAKKYFLAFDEKDESVHQHAGGGLTFPSLAVNTVAMGSLLGFATDAETSAKYDAVIKATYENLDSNFWTPDKYLTPFYQLCVGYDWFNRTPDFSEKEAFTTNDVIEAYCYKVDLAAVSEAKLRAWLLGTVADGTIDQAERRAFVYMQAYYAGARVLGIYSPERCLVKELK